MEGYSLIKDDLLKAMMAKLESMNTKIESIVNKDIPIPLTEENCLKYWKVSLIVLKRKIEEGANIKVYGERKSMFFYLRDVDAYVQSLGENKGKKSA